MNHVFSPTQISTYLECSRKWAWRTIAKVEAPQAQSAQLGSKVHGILEKYLELGTMPNYLEDGVAAEIASSGLQHLPEPKSAGLEVEKHFKFQSERGFWFQGYKDVSYLDGSVAVVIDHKTTSDLKWAKTPEILRTDPQAIIYAKHAMDDYQVESSELRWVYYQTKGSRKSKRVHLRLTRAEVTPAFEALEDIASEMATILERGGDVTARVLALPAQPKACEAYGGCPYQHLCNLSPAERMKGIMSQGMSGLLGRLKQNAAAVSPEEIQPPLSPSWLDEKTEYKGVTAKAEPPAINPPEHQAPPPATIPAPPPVEAAKKPRATKAKAPTPETPPPPMPKGFTLFVDCAPMGEEACSAEHYYAAARKTVNKTAGVSDFRLVDYGKGAGLFAEACGAALENTPDVQSIVINTGTAEAHAALSTFVERAARVVRGVR